MTTKTNILLLLSAGIAGCAIPAKKAEQKPNIVFILADDLGYGELGCYGQENFQTPFIDSLAAQGMRFTDFYAGNTVSAPSRCCLVTGRHPGNASVRGNSGWPDGTIASKQRVGITAADTTIAEILKKAGYKTALCGKWHIETANDTAVNWPVSRGFDFVIRERFSKDVKQRRKKILEDKGLRYDDNYPYEMWKNGKRIVIEENMAGEDGYLMDDIVVDHGLKFIAEHKDEPFFIFFSLKIPHSPETLHTYDTLYRDKGWPECERVHAARIRYQDGHVRRIVGLIDSLGIGENTLVMFSSDNGGHSEGGYKHPSFDPCKHDHTFFNSNAPLRGYKRDLYDGGIRVPFIARWTGHIKPSSTSSHIAAFWDMMATLADVAGAEVAYQHDGISFLPEMTGKEQKEHDYLYWEFFQGYDTVSNFKQAVRMGKWKAVRYGLDKETELYDMQKDIGESNDISNMHPRLVRKMDSLFKASSSDNPYYPYGGVKVKRSE